MRLLALLLSAGIAHAEWNLDALPHYHPRNHMSGVIRIFGSDLGGMIPRWEKGFHKFQPDVRFEDKLPTGDAAIAGLIAGADLGPSGRETETVELLAFNETFGSLPLGITVATGSYDVLGRSWGEIIFVNEANPIDRLTMQQLDGIFGAERTGGWKGFQWSPAAARDAGSNIRAWGQLGLLGEWSARPIQTYGYAPTGMSNFFELEVFHGGSKWNPNLREYVETGTKQVPNGAHAVTIDQMFRDLAQDRYGIGWAGIPQWKGVQGVKPLAIAGSAAGPAIAPSRESFQNRTYPLTRSIYIYVRSPGSPESREFLLYILSREGQNDVAAQGEYLPLTEAIVRRERAKLLKNGSS